MAGLNGLIPLKSGWRRALVVFAPDAQLWYLKALKPGFRHCFLALEGDGFWLLIDPLSTGLDVQFLPQRPDLDPACFYRALNLTVVEASPKALAAKPLPLRFVTCVEVVKRVLGITASGIWTPYQLYRHLNQNKNKQETFPLTAVAS